MTSILEIGDTSVYFPRWIRLKNLGKRFTIFQGHPGYREMDQDLVMNLLAEGRRRTVRVKSNYDSFPFPEQSLDMVFCNFPEKSTAGIEEEVQRTLKPHGIFFYSHLGLVGSSERMTELLGDDFKEMVNERYPPIFYMRQANGNRLTINLRYFIAGIERMGLPIIIPPSKECLKHALEVYRDHSAEKQMQTGQPYERPHYHIWQRQGPAQSLK